jgi:hypothetical protein
MSLRLDRNGVLARSSSSRRRRVIKRTAGIGKKRIKRLSNIEQKNRQRFNSLLRCPSCKQRAGKNEFCVVCAIKRERRSKDGLF